VRSAPELVHLPTRSSQPVASFVRPVADPETLRRLATTAIDAAIQAGADWADVRIGDRRYLAGDTIKLTYGFGVRVRVGNAEAFLGGGSPTPERMIRAARSATATARGIIRERTWSAELARPLAPTPVIKGEWHAPIAIDPFTVPVDDHWLAGRSNRGANDIRLRASVGGNKSRMGGATWYSETRVFASSEGSLLTQFLGGATVGMWTLEDRLWRREIGTTNLIWVPGDDLESCTAGFEVVVRPDRHERLEALGREIDRYRALPYGWADVGRYNVVLDGSAHAALLQEMLVPALSLRRVLGEDADVDGLSPFMPPADWVGQDIAAQPLSMQVDAGAPRYGAAAWDDEGVATKTSPLVVDGKLVRFLTSRATAPLMAASATSGADGGHSESAAAAALLGTARVTDVTHQPLELPPSISALPGSGGSITALAKQMGTGILVRGAYVTVNPQGTGGFIDPSLAFEVRRGELVRRIGRFRFSFSSKKMLKNLVAMGDASTLRSYTGHQVVSFPWTDLDTVVRAPAATYKNIDLTTNLSLSA